MRLYATSILSLALGISAVTIGPVADLFISNRKVAPDGYTRDAVLAGTSSGGTLLGPVITGNKGDRFRLNVVNNLKNSTMLRSTSIHWHGFFQAGTSYADGPVGVTQCPIAPGDSFLYDFRVPDQAGTFWYHSHYRVQYCDGLRGAFVVYDPYDPYKKLYDVDDESTIITLTDWYHRAAPFSRLAPEPDSALINGRGRAYDGSYPTSQLAVINVVRGKRYRFRLISTSCNPNYVFSIDNHNMTIIEVDGENHDPYTVDAIPIFIGQRYSFILNANQPIDNYWIRANPNRGTQGFLGGINSATLRYQGARRAEPKTTSTISNLMLETNLHPTENPGAPGGSAPADLAFNLDISFDLADFFFTLNGVKGFEPPTVPVLLQILSGARTVQELLPPGNIFTLPHNKVIEVSIPGGSPGFPHPFHIHGHTFDVIRSAGSSTYNFVNPVRRDVVNTGGAGDNVTIRFKTDNNGPWIFHCHIDWHIDNGLAIVFAENPDGIATQQRPPAAWDKLCPIFNALPPDEH